MTPYIDNSGADWAADLFEATAATQKILVLRGSDQLERCGTTGVRLRRVTTKICDYSLVGSDEDGRHSIETFHAKIVLSDGAAAYVGSANFLYRSRETNLECGFLMEGDAVAPVAVLVDALLSMFSP
jgi:phosphatidylserine/phosphatidylglycerophosphate/cardiolipin synthase-like enzyme